MDGLKAETKVKIPCSTCGKESDIKAGWHLRHNINFCSEKCVYDFIEEFMVMTFGNVRKSEKKLKELENRINVMMKARKQKK